VAPCALASQFPRIVNLIAAQWNDHQNTPELFADLLGDRRGGRAGFPPAVRRDLLNLQEFWYSGKLSVR
jgi:tankyrase